MVVDDFFDEKDKNGKWQASDQQDESSADISKGNSWSVWLLDVVVGAWFRWRKKLFFPVLKQTELPEF